MNMMLPSLAASTGDPDPTSQAQPALRMTPLLSDYRAQPGTLPAVPAGFDDSWTRRVLAHRCKCKQSKCCTRAFNRMEGLWIK